MGKFLSNGISNLSKNYIKPVKISFGNIKFIVLSHKIYQCTMFMSFTEPLCLKSSILSKSSHVRSYSFLPFRDTYNIPKIGMELELKFEINRP